MIGSFTAGCATWVKGCIHVDADPDVERGRKSVSEQRHTATSCGGGHSCSDTVFFFCFFVCSNFDTQGEIYLGGKMTQNVCCGVKYLSRINAVSC